MLYTGYFGVYTGFGVLLCVTCRATALAALPYPVLFMTLLPRKKHDPASPHLLLFEKNEKALYNQGKMWYNKAY